MLFFETFSDLKADERLRTIYKNVDVSKATFSNNESRMDIFTVSSKFIKRDDIVRMEQLLYYQVFAPANKNVRLHVRFDVPEKDSFNDVWNKYNSYVLDELDRESGLIGSIYRNSYVTAADSRINIEMADSFVNRDYEPKIRKIIYDFFDDSFDMKTEIGFSYKPIVKRNQQELSYAEQMAAYSLAASAGETGAAQETAEPKDKADAGSGSSSVNKESHDKGATAGQTGGRSDSTAADKNTMSAQKAGEPAKNQNDASQKGGFKRDFSANRFVRKKLVEDPDVIYGYNCEGDITAINDIHEEFGEFVIHGMILRIEDPRITSKGSMIYKFYLTDFTSTIMCKMFIRDQEEIESVPKKFKEGMFIRVKGEINTDNFEKNETVMHNIRGIKPVPDFRVKRTDNAPVKRIELHAHTMYSDMDGVIDPKKLVLTALKWGHRGIAITDHGVVQGFPVAFHGIDPKSFKTPEEQEAAKNFKIIYGCEGYLVDDEPDEITDSKGRVFKKGEDGKYSVEDIQKMPSYHVIILCKNDVGRVNLYKMISLGHLTYFGRWPRIPKSVLEENREGLIIGSACEAGELYRAIVHEKPAEEIARIAKFYDYYEIQQIGNNAYMIDSDKFPEVQNENDLRRINKRISDLAEADGKLCIATNDVHFLNPEDEIYRRIIMASKGFEDADKQAPLYLHTTEEMLEECRYLGDERAYQVVIENPNKIFDMCEKIEPVRPDKCPPVIENSDKTLTDICYRRAHEIYGPDLPVQVSSRLEHELESIIKNGFAVMYIIAQKLVWKSNEDGYLVGSRGSVGSSFVATMSGITEINPLSPHYYCKKCHYSEFDSDVCKEYVAKSGCDMPDKVCPNCGEPLVKEGHNIPFETFLGFNGDKEPDIDLNFSGEYQSKAHDYTEVIFGPGQTFRAGTIGGVADKTAFGMVSKYCEERGIRMRDAEKERIAAGCVGVRRTTGQHPGGIVVLPIGENIYSFTPLQHPANDMTTSTVTTHFEYHSIDHNLLKLDILGHDDPTMIRMLEDLTGLDAKTIPMDDEKVISLFASCDALGVKPEDIDNVELGSLGLPELGTNFVMQMLKDTKPQCFSDMVKIAGLSHGTDVWLNNAQYYIANGDCTLSTAICTRDDIMIYLINQGMEPGLAFKTMESVRKGKGLKPEMEEAMLAVNVPNWYIESCKKIKYMFPKAHACAYMMMAFRIAYFKIYYPLAYYAAFFSIRAADFNYEKMCQGKNHLLACMKELREKGEKLSAKESGEYDDMRLVLEFYARGFEFMPIDIYQATARQFRIIDGKLMPCFNSIAGLGDKAAEQIYDVSQRVKFVSRDEFKQRCKVGDTMVKLMTDLGILSDLPESDQMSFADFFSSSLME